MQVLVYLSIALATAEAAGKWRVAAAIERALHRARQDAH